MKRKFSACGLNGSVGIVHHQDGDGRPQGLQGMGYAWEGPHRFQHGNRHLATLGEITLEPVEVGPSGQVAEPQKVDHFLVRGTRGQVSDGNGVGTAGGRRRQGYGEKVLVTTTVPKGAEVLRRCTSCPSTRTLTTSSPSAALLLNVATTATLVFTRN